MPRFLAYPEQATPRRGVVLVAVLIVVTLLSLAAYQYSDLMMAEYRAADNAYRVAQARALAESGVYYAAAILSNTDNFQNLLNSNPFDNANAFQDVSVPGEGGSPGRFSITAPPDGDNNTGQTLRFGVTDEGGKINLNALMQRDPKGDLLYDALMLLPNMTDEIANSIVDWLDSDSQPRQNGAENDYYTAQSPSYRCKNGPLESLDELLLVRGVTPDLLYGNDRNRNNLLDPGEHDGSGVLDRGWSAYLTIYSREQNVDSQGKAKTYINDSDMTALYEKLTSDLNPDLVKYIVLYRQYGPTSTKSSFASSLASLLGGGSSKSKGKKGGKSSSTTPTTINGSISDVTRENLKLTSKPQKKISSLFELVNTTVTIPAKDSKSPSVVITSPLNDLGLQRELLPKLFMKTTTEQKTDIPARINVNTAPREVLLTIPNLTDTDVEQILTVRPPPGSADNTSDTYKTPAWLLTEANVSTTTLKKVEKYITAQTQVYRVHVASQLENRGPTARAEAVIDMNAGRPRIIFYRDLSELGGSGKSNQSNP